MTRDFVTYALRELRGDDMRERRAAGSRDSCLRFRLSLGPDGARP